MRYMVTCAQCPGYVRTSEFPDRPGAEGFVRRHHALKDRRAEITEEQQ